MILLYITDNIISEFGAGQKKSLINNNLQDPCFQRANFMFTMLWHGPYMVNNSLVVALLLQNDICAFLNLYLIEEKK